MLLWIVLEIQIKGQETAQVGHTLCLTGNVEFHPSVKYLKWQKYHNGYFVDININKSKYQGSTKNLQNPKLVINDVDQDDEADYRLEVQLAKSSQHSNIRNVKILSSTALGENYFSLVLLDWSLFECLIAVKFPEAWIFTYNIYTCKCFFPFYNTVCAIRFYSCITLAWVKRSKYVAHE